MFRVAAVAGVEQNGLANGQRRCLDHHNFPAIGNAIDIRLGRAARFAGE